VGGRAALLAVAALLVSAPAAIAAPPANDAFPGTTITGDAAGTNVDATCQSGEPAHDAVWGCWHSVWYTYVAPASQTVVLDLCDASFSSEVAVYTGSAVNALTLVARNASSHECAGGRSKTSFKAVAGTTYRIAVDGEGDLFGPGAQGTFTLNFTTGAPPANDDRANAIVVNEAAESGDNAFATLEANEATVAGGGGASVWWTWTAPADGPVIVDTCGSTFDTTLRAIEDGFQTVMATNDNTSQCADPTAPRSLITFDATQNTVYDIQVDGWGGDTG
jgi:hypothetical protein